MGTVHYVVFFALFVISAVIAAGGCVLIADSYGAVRELGFAAIGTLAWYGTFKLGCNVLFWFETVGDTGANWEKIRLRNSIYFKRPTGSDGPLLRYDTDSGLLWLVNLTEDEKRGYVPPFASFSEANAYLSRRPAGEKRPRPVW